MENAFMYAHRLRMTAQQITPERDRVNVTMPSWLRSEATMYGAKRGYGLSELITRELERFVSQEKDREASLMAMSEKVVAAIKKK